MTTLDGRLSSLDFTNGGALQWSVPTEPGDLVSSSIHRLELTNNGKYVRMIPSLSGGIYKFDGDSLEAVPMTAEDLLKSSFKFTDDMVISGGKETRIYGINTRTGNLVYEYSMNGGSNSKKSSQNITDILNESSENTDDPFLDDVLVVKRQTQTVRAIEPRTGTERWNFSIGHHELELMPSDNCRSQSGANDELDDFLTDLDLRVIIPEGLICGCSKKTNAVLWRQKFDAPIVSVFRMNENNELYSVDLFKNVQWLWNGQNFFKPSFESKVMPSVYLGMYQQQLYIQESDSIKESFDNHKQLEHDINDEDKFLKIPFKAYPASNTAIVKLIEGGGSHEESNEEEGEGSSKKLTSYDNSLNAQSVLYASPYAEGKGFFLFTNKSEQCEKKGRSTNTTPLNLTYDHGIIARTSSLFDYWKEISVIALTTAFVINVMLNNRRKSEQKVVYVLTDEAQGAIEFEKEKLKRKLEDDKIREEALAKVRSISESNKSSFDESNHYVSRFLTDFDLVQCLGRGGFGVVFEVKNKLDDCNYAIKRILLPTKKESRERVMREVKTLANCEHKNIVRYFHAWVEQPPKDWQEVRDKDLCRDTSITIESPTPTEESKAFMTKSQNKPFNRGFTSNSSWLLNQQQNQFDELSRGGFYRNSSIDDSSSFIQFKADSNALDETEDNAFESEESDDGSFRIEFKNDSQTSMSEAPTEGSRVISTNGTGDKSCFEEPKKKGHRRQMSLDLPSLSDIKLKKTNVDISGASNKMYLYIQMQLCMKNSLKDWLRNNDLQLRNGKTLEIWNQIIEAVHYVHLKGLIHRDLKPGNIFFALDGQIKIGDFGLVTDMAEIPTDLLTSSSSNSNSSGNVVDFNFTSISQKKHTQRVGTSLYMSPEQSKGLPYNYKVDIFSLGLILFELLNYFSTETERFKVLENLRKHVFPSEFIENHKDEVSCLNIFYKDFRT